MKQSSEQLDFAVSVTSLLGEFWSIDEVERYARGDAGVDDQYVWTSLVTRGLAHLTLPEDRGGSSATLMDVLPIMMEGGARLLPTSWQYQGVLPALVLSGGQTPEMDLVSSLADGTANWVFVDPLGTTSTASDEGPRASGSHLFSVGADLTAGVLRDEELWVYTQDTLRPCVAPRRTPDRTRSFCDVVLRGDLEPSLRLRIGRPGIARYRRRWEALQFLAIAADSVGGSRRCIDMSVEHAKVREQFGVPIGSFQAVKHQLVDIYGWHSQAESALFHAASLFDREGATDRVLHLSRMAKRLAAQAHTQASKTSLQVLGGIGFTWEHECHWHVKRAMMNSALVMDESTIESVLFDGLTNAESPILLGDLFQ